MNPSALGRVFVSAQQCVTARLGLLCHNFSSTTKTKLICFTTALAIIETHSALLARGPGSLSSVPQNATAPQPRAMGSLHSFFAPGGVLSGSHPAYEFRRGQLQMAEAVEQALTDRRHLLVEAGTGTGKTLAAQPKSSLFCATSAS